MKDFFDLLDILDLREVVDHPLYHSAMRIFVRPFQIGVEDITYED